MKTYEFTLILKGFSELTEDIEDRLFEAGCDDALLGLRGGIPYLDFEREADSFLAAVLSAIEAVHAAGVAKVVRVEPEDLVSAAEIAARTDRTRESIRLLYEGQRGPGGFPVPLNPSSKTRLWRWTEVERWMGENGLLVAEPGETSNIVAAVNGALDIRRNASPQEARDIVIHLLPVTVDRIMDPTIMMMRSATSKGYRPHRSAHNPARETGQQSQLERSTTTFN